MNDKYLQFSFNFETKNKILAEIHNLDKKSLSKKWQASIIRYLMRLSPHN